MIEVFKYLARIVIIFFFLTITAKAAYFFVDGEFLSDNLPINRINFQVDSKSSSGQSQGEGEGGGWKE